MGAELVANSMRGIARSRLWLAGFSLIVAWASFSAIHGQVAGLYHDDGIYAAVAKSLAEGQGYRIASLPTNLRKQNTISSLVSSPFTWKLDPKFPENCSC